ncbi:HNH endonuclease family protein [Streptomyces sp. NPDC049040]|uniref:HNH endonuclease family protein n=1 Tax=Streptomyces sp. NPDC049040 TaxID=3365593 RepID=UPI00371B4C5F
MRTLAGATTALAAALAGFASFQRSRIRGCPWVVAHVAGVGGGEFPPLCPVLTCLFALGGHVVPLAEAWDSGAYGWTPARRQDYANDLDWSRSLVAVTARTNRQKADQDPSTWTPPAEDAQCHYLADWVSVKTRWQLSVDPAEQQVLITLASACEDEELAVPLA